MTLLSSFKTSFRGLRINKSRSALTILGIVIGVGAIIIVVALGQGAQDLILNQIRGIGSKTIAIVPGRHPKGPSDVVQTFSDSLKERDLRALKQKSNVPYAEDVMPIVFGGVSGEYHGETYWFTIFGGTEQMSKQFDISPDFGVFIAPEDVTSRADVIVIGDKVKQELFGETDPIGQKIKIKGRNFRVIGTMPSKGQLSFFNLDEVGIMPYTTAQQYVFGIKHYNRIVVSAMSEDLIPETVADIKQTLRDNHGITDPEKDDFFTETQGEAIEQVSVITTILTLFLASVAAISLLVGGIGIMNIMLVSVTERTREIGLRKAVGATEGNILTQFLLEAIILTVSGGVVGIILGSLLSFITALTLSRIYSLDWTFTFPLSAALLGFGVSATVGLIFGLYPARQAAKKNPIEALRYE
jgi:putative ABC transport system permease protein